MSCSAQRAVSSAVRSGAVRSVTSSTACTNVPNAVPGGSSASGDGTAAAAGPRCPAVVMAAVVAPAVVAPSVVAPPVATPPSAVAAAPSGGADPPSRESALAVSKTETRGGESYDSPSSGEGSSTTPGASGSLVTPVAWPAPAVSAE